MCVAFSPFLLNSSVAVCLSCSTVVHTYCLQELDRSKLPSFRKVSCHSLSDDSVSITAVTTKNNSAHSHSGEKACLRGFVIDIPQISYDSSLPSTSRTSRGGRRRGGGEERGGDRGGEERGRDKRGGGGGKKRPMTRGPLHPAKRGRAACTNSRNNAASVVSDFDSLMFDYRRTKPATPNSAPLGTSRVGGDSVKEVLEIPDSPPLPPHAAEFSKEVALVHSPTPSSSSSTNELTAIQLTSQLHEDTPPSSLPSPSLPEPLTTRYTSAQVVSSTHSLAPDEAISQGRPPKRAQWSEEDVNRIDLDGDEDCLITEHTTTSRYFGDSKTGQGVKYPLLLPPSSPSTAANIPTDSLASAEAELLQFKKTSANFSRVASNLPQVASSPHSSVSNSTLPQPPALRQSMFQALEDFNNSNTGHSSDVGGDNYRGNVRVPAIIVPTSSTVAPRLTNPELDGDGEGEGDVVISSTTRNIRWAERRGGGRGRSVFDVLEKNSSCESNHTNTSSFYGGGIYEKQLHFQSFLY